jgi:hypothetical protein
VGAGTRVGSLSVIAAGSTASSHASVHAARAAEALVDFTTDFTTDLTTDFTTDFTTLDDHIRRTMRRLDGRGLARTGHVSTGHVSANTGLVRARPVSANHVRASPVRGGPVGASHSARGRSRSPLSLPGPGSGRNGGRKTRSKSPVGSSRAAPGSPNPITGVTHNSPYNGTHTGNHTGTHTGTYNGTHPTYVPSRDYSLPSYQPRHRPTCIDLFAPVSQADNTDAQAGVDPAYPQGIFTPASPVGGAGQWAKKAVKVVREAWCNARCHYCDCRFRGKGTVLVHDERCLYMLERQSFAMGIIIFLRNLCL